MQEQAHAADRAAASLDRLWDLQQRSSVLSGDEYAYFLNLYQMTHDELRISSVRRYDDSFVPARPFDADNRTLTLFHFDGDLNAETPAGCRAMPGPVQ